MEFATVRNASVPLLRLDWLARIFAKFFADVFLLESQATGKSENDDINRRFMVGLGGLELPTSPLSG